jgi:hypothetical protein
MGPTGLIKGIIKIRAGFINDTLEGWHQDVFDTVQTFPVLVPYVPAYEDAIAGKGTVLAVVHDIVGEILFIYRKTSKEFCLHFFV